MRGQLPYWVQTDLVDDGSYDLPAGLGGFLQVMAGNTTIEWAHVVFGTDGAVTLIANSANVRATDTDTFLCVFDNGANVRIRNRLGSTQRIRIIVGGSPA